MKLYIKHCQNCQSKIPLSFSAINRQQVRNMYGDTFNIECPTCHFIETYNPSLIFAETDSNSAVGGGVVGGVIGLVGGPLGGLIGALIGSSIGSSNDNDDKNSVIRFNTSQ